MEIILSEKPDTNIFEFEITGVEDLDFVYQAPYNEQNNPEDIAAGVVIKTETQGLDKDGNIIASMPENAVGSYAVYHKTKMWHSEGVMNYATGKAFHIYRPELTDGSGKKSWGVLNFDGSILSVTIPDLVYNDPSTDWSYFVIDPTFGYTVEGASEVNNGDFILGRFTGPGESGTVTTLHAFMRVGVVHGHSQMALYDAGSSLQSPQSDEIHDEDGLNNSEWAVHTITGTLSITDQNYAIQSWADDVSIFLKRDTGFTSGDSKFLSGETYNSWPASPTWSDSTSRYSTYATYTAEAPAEVSATSTSQVIMWGW